MSDLINRQKAIDALVKDCKASDEGMLNMYDIVCDLKDLPSAQPELIRCKNCKHNQLPSTSGNANCEIFYGMTNQDGFCHMAERRTDEQT